MTRRTLLLGALPLWAQKLPSVLIIGDSISMGYTPFVRTLLEGKAEVQRISGNGADSANVAAHLSEWLAAGPFDVVSLNCGLHDLKFTDRHQVPLDSYERNLRQIFEKISSSRARLIWVTTTPIHDERHTARKAGFARTQSDVLRYNATARQLAEKNGIPVCDLHAVVARAGADTLLSRDGTHYESAGYQLLAEEVAGCIESRLKRLE